MPGGPRISRRGFLVGAGALTAGSLLGGLAWEVQQVLDPASSPTGQLAVGAPTSGTGPLVVVTLSGGNDGLNMVVPYLDRAYAQVRPTLGYHPSEVLDLADGLGLNPKLSGFRTLWQAGQLAVVRGVGYPNPNLSHFESMGIWQTANPTDGTGSGWLGRWLDLTGDDPMRAISVGDILPPMLRGERQSATAVTPPRITLPGAAALKSGFEALQTAAPDRQGMAAAVASAGAELLEVQGRLDNLPLPGPSATPGTAAGPAVTASNLSGQLGVVAELINAGAPTLVYQVSLSSFDTHANEKGNQERLLADLDQAVTTFLAAIASSPGAGRNAVLLTISEFGRRPAENASGGTDHGAASPLLVIGRTVRGGRFYGDQPSLTHLDANGNQIYNVDFRSVYATVLDHVVGIDPTKVLGGGFRDLGFL